MFNYWLNKEKKHGLRSSLMVHQKGAYPGFLSKKLLGLFLPMDGTLVHLKVTPRLCQYFTWVERGSLNVKYLA